MDHDYLLVFTASARTRRLIPLLLHDFSRIPVDTSVVAYLRERYRCDAAAFAAERSSWGAHLALGYRLIRLREKLEKPARARSE